MRLVILMISVFLMAGTAVASDLELAGQGEKLRSMQIGFLTERLALSPAEAEKFWPVYKEYLDKKESLRKGAKSETAADAYIARQEEEVSLNKQYNERFKQILGASKVSKLYQAEKDFKKKLIDMARQRRVGAGK